MTPSPLEVFFEERYGEIEDYLALLGALERAAQGGAPRFEGVAERISTSQQKILYSSLYLQLYNLVEATVSRCLAEVTAAAVSANVRAMDLSGEFKQEWVRALAKTHIDLTPENRLQAAVMLCDHVIGQLPIAHFDLEVGGGGNWDDVSIEKIGRRLGCNLQLTRATVTAAKRHLRDNMGALKLVKDRRNGLAHGSLSFVDCSDGVTVAELERVAEVVGSYLREVTQSFSRYVAAQEFKSSAGTSGVA